MRYALVLAALLAVGYVCPASAASPNFTLYDATLKMQGASLLVDGYTKSDHRVHTLVPPKQNERWFPIGKRGSKVVSGFEQWYVTPNGSPMVADATSIIGVPDISEMVAAACGGQGLNCDQAGNLNVDVQILNGTVSIGGTVTVNGTVTANLGSGLTSTMVGDVVVGGTSTANTANLTTIGTCTNISAITPPNKISELVNEANTAQNQSLIFSIYDEAAAACTATDQIYTVAGAGAGQIFTLDMPLANGLTWQLTYANALAAPVPTPTTTASPAGSCTNGAAYKYEVAGLNGPGGTQGQEGPPSSEITTTPGAGSLSIVISWSAVTGDNGYALYRTAANGASGSEAFLATSAPGATSYTDGCTLVLNGSRVPVAVYGQGYLMTHN
jgi:hypothetical protein